MHKMKKFRLLICTVMTCLTVVSGAMSVCAAGVDVDVIRKNSASIEDVKGKIELNSGSDTTIKDVDADYIKTKKVYIDTSAIDSDGGKVTIRKSDKTKYENVHADSVHDINIDVIVPTIYGDDVDLEIETANKTEYENSEIGKVYKIDKTVVRPIILPGWAKNRR